MSSVWALTAARPGRLYPANQPEPSRRPFSLSPVSSPYRGQSSTPVVGWECPWPAEPNKRLLTFRPCFFFCTATMVQGPSDAVVHASFPQIDVSLSCALNSGQADCVGQIQQPGMTITTSLRESVKPYLVQGGGSGGSPSSPGPTPAPVPSQSGSLSSTGTDDGSGAVAVMTRSGVTGVKVLVGSVVAGMVATLFLV